MVEPVFFDTGVLWSFAVAEALEDLGNGYAGRARWTPSVKREIEHFVASDPRLGEVAKCAWLDLYEFDPNDLSATTAVERIRKTFGVSARQNQHRGESECIVAALADDGWFATEDFDAARRAEREGVRVNLMTTEVIHALVQQNVIDCPRALTVYHAMEAAGRQIPKDLTVQDLCW